MTELGTNNFGSEQGARLQHNHVSRPKLSLDSNEPELTSEPDVYDEATTGTNAAAFSAREAAIRAAEAAAAAAAASRASAPHLRHFDVDTEPSAEYEKVEDYELEEGAVEPELPASNQPSKININSGSSIRVRVGQADSPARSSLNQNVSPSPAAPTAHPVNVAPAKAPRPIAINAARSAQPSASVRPVQPVSSPDRPAARHPYQVHAAEARAARQELEAQIMNAAHPSINTRERKEQAIARALAAVQPIEKETDVLARNVSTASAKSTAKLDRTHSKRKKQATEKAGLSAGRRFALAFSVAAVAVTGLAFLIINSVPDISLQVAAMQVGIDATYPAYVPRGYTMTSVTSNDGRIRLTFSDDENTFVITESQSSWDTSAVLNNYVKPEWETYTTTHENGITVYLNNSNAAWVNGGIFYTVECENNALTKKQLTNIVAGL